MALTAASMTFQGELDRHTDAGLCRRSAPPFPLMASSSCGVIHGATLAMMSASFDQSTHPNVAVIHVLHVTVVVFLGGRLESLRQYPNACPP